MKPKNTICLWFDKGAIVDRAQKAAATDPRSALVRINIDCAHSRKVYDQAIAGTKTCKAVTSTAYGGENSDYGGRFDRHLHISLRLRSGL